MSRLPYFYNPIPKGLWFKPNNGNFDFIKIQHNNFSKVWQKEK